MKKTSIKLRRGTECLLLTFLMISFTCICWAQFGGGNGTQDDPWQIATAEHLNNTRNHLNGHYLQIADINLGVEPWNTGQGWVPIGTGTIPFTGSYDGGGFSINNLTINRAGINYQALFARTNNATIRNIGLNNADISGNMYVAGFIAYMTGTSSIRFCYVTGEITGNRSLGGIVGDMRTEECYIHDCYSAATINHTGAQYAGGIIGYQYRGDTRRCYAIGLIESDGSAGAVSGRTGGGTFEYNYWDTQTTNRQAGCTRGRFPQGAKTTAEMTYPYAANTYLTFDFQEVWDHDIEGLITRGYPVLYYQRAEAAPEAPQVTASLITIDDVEHIRIRWQSVTNARSYLIYASFDPYSDDWGEPIDIVGAETTHYEEAITDSRKKYFYVVSSTQNVP